MNKYLICLIIFGMSFQYIYGCPGGTTTKVGIVDHIQEIQGFGVLINFRAPSGYDSGCLPDPNIDYFLSFEDGSVQFTHAAMPILAAAYLNGDVVEFTYVTNAIYEEEIITVSIPE